MIDTYIDSFMDCDIDPRQTEVKGRNRESSFFHKGNEESAKAGVHMHWNALPTHLLSINCWRQLYVPDAQRSNLLYAINGSMGELGSRADEHDGARADHPAHCLHLHPLRHLVHRHVPGYWML